MKITVVTLASTTTKSDYVAALKPHATVNDLKTLLQETHGIPMHQQLLLSPSTSHSPLHHPFTSPYGLLYPLGSHNTLSPSSTVYLSLRVRVHDTNSEREHLVDLTYSCTIGHLCDEIKSLTKIPLDKMSVSWGTLKFGPYNDCALDSVCDGLWDNHTQPFVVSLVPSSRGPSNNKKGAELTDSEGGQLDTDSEDERARESGYITPGAVFIAEHRRKYNNVGPICTKRMMGTFFGIQYKKIGHRPVVVDAVDPPGMTIPKPEGLCNIEFIKDPEIKFVILWLGNQDGLQNLLVRFNFHKKSTTRCVVVRGERDLATYCFLRKLKADLINVPICALTDCDPYSLKVLAFLRHPLVEFPPKLQRQFGGEWKKKASMYGAKIEIKWLGLKPSYNRFCQMEKFDMAKKDLETAKVLLGEEGFAGMFPEWAEELKLMIEDKEMAKIEAFGGFGEEYLTSVFLVEELGKHRCCRVKLNHGRR